MGQPCLPNPDCDQAPILCGFDLDNLAHNTQFGSPIFSYPPTFPSDCPNSTIDNNQFIGFVPCSPFVEIEVQTLGCMNFQGLQAIIYETHDCVNFIKQSNCLTQIFPGTSGILIANGLVPGNVYYLMIDGFGGDECDYEVNILSGIDTLPGAPGQGSPGYIVPSSQTLCTGTTFTFTLVPPTCSGSGGAQCVTPFPMQDCATLNWNFPQGANILSQSGLTVQVEFTQPALGQVSVGFTLSNPNCQCYANCGGGCQTTITPLPISVGPPQTVTLPPLTRCVGDVVFFCGQMHSVSPGGLNLACQTGCTIEQQEVFAQPCPANCLQYNQPVPPGDACATAAPFCASYLNGYCSNNTGYSPDTPGNLATVLNCSIENNQWLSFVPCEDSVAFTLSVSNCSATGGMEFAVLRTFNCQNFSVVANCQTIAPGSFGILEVSNLQIGDTYYLMVDGVNGDACNWQINSLFGVSTGTVLQEDITSGSITGTCDLCLDSPTTPSAPITYTATGPDCKIVPVNPANNTCAPGTDFSCPPAFQKFREPFLDTLYDEIAWDTVWSIIPPTAGYFVNNDNIGSTVEVVWDSVGNFLLDADIIPVAWDTIIFMNDGIEECLTICADNDPCDIPPKEVNVGVSDTEFESYQICAGECVTVHGQTICSPGQFTITAPDITGCIDTFFVTVIQLPPMFVFIAGQTKKCYGEPFQLFANSSDPNAFYFWSNGASGPAVTVTQPGTISVTAMNFDGCQAFAQTTLSWYPQVPPTTLPPLSVCQEDLPYNFYGTNVTTTGNYSETLTNWQGCDSTVSQFITVLPAVTATITSSEGTTLPPGVTTILDAGSGFGSYLWSDMSTGQTLSTDQPGTYSVAVTTSAGCTGTASITLVAGMAPLCAIANFPIAPADSCAAAPPFCASYLNGFCSSNSGYTADVPGNLGQIVPCSIENSQWLKFTTCDSTVQLVLSVTNCTSAKGLEFFVLQTTNCQSFVSKAACYGLANGSLDTLTVSGLTVGGAYHLMVDGIDGDICQWEVLTTIGVSSGSIYQEENTPGQVTGPTAICAGGTASFAFTSPICDLLPIGGCPPAFQQSCIPQLDTCIAIQYDTIWSVTPAGTVFVNNDSLGLNVTVVFPDTLPISPGGSMDFIVSVKLVSVPGDTLTCPADCIAECLEIIPDTELCGILPLTVTVCMPDNTTEQMAICPGECVDFYGETYCQPGTYMAASTGQCGCVNNHTLLLEWVQEVPPVVLNLTEACDPTGAEYTVSFNVQGFGNPIFVNGQPLTGPTFTSMAMPSGQPYTFLVEMMGICDTYADVVSGSFTCPPCVGDTIDLGTISLCPSESFPLLGNSYSAPGTYSELLLNPATSCYETYEFILEQIVENQLVVSPVSENCDASNLNYTVAFSIETGTPPYSVNGVPLSGNFYQSGLIQSGQIYDFTVTDAATCNPQQLSISGSFTCSCASSPGTVGLSVINQCEGEMATASFNNDAVVDSGDLLVFILHTSASNALGTVIGTNATGTFGFVPGLMNFGETYYISPAVGPDQGGTVDFSNVCFSLSPGQPIVFYEKPEVQVLAPDTLTCSLNTLMLNALPSGGSGDFSFEWTGPNGFSATEANPSVNEPGAYLLLLTDNVTGCQAQSGTAVGSDTSLPVFTVTSGEINCQQATALLVAASQLAGVTYTWTFPTGSTMSGDTIFTEIPGDYLVTALGPNGCIANAVTFVLDNGVPPSVSATGGSINCSESTAELFATSNEPTATFTWKLPDSTTAIGATLTASMLGTYTVTVAGANGCTAEASTEIVQGPDPDLMTEVEVGDPTCFGYSDGFIKVLGTTGGTAPYGYTLNDTLVGDFFQDLTAGDYLLSTTDSNGCMGSDTIQLVHPPEIMVQIGADQFVDFGQSVTLTMQSNITPDSIVWYGPRGEVWPGVNSLTLNPTENGRYTIIISDVNLCRSSDTTYIYINGKGKVFVPTAFSPNRDGVNDALTVYAGGDVEKIIEMQIFDRWGEMVFVQKDFNPNDPVHGWDGRLDGKELDPGVFVVKIMVLFKDGTKKLLVSDVVLMR
jgi:gliding motility-associated-like protein